MRAILSVLTITLLTSSLAFAQDSRGRQRVPPGGGGQGSGQSGGGQTTRQESSPPQRSAAPRSGRESGGSRQAGGPSSSAPTTRAVERAPRREPATGSTSSPNTARGRERDGSTLDVRRDNDRRAVTAPIDGAVAQQEQRSGSARGDGRVPPPDSRQAVRRGDAQPRPNDRPDSRPVIVNRPGRNVYYAPSRRVYNDRYYYYPRDRYPYGYGSFGLGYFYYDPYVWAPQSQWYYNGYNYGYGHGYAVGEIRIDVRPRHAEVYVDGYYAGTVDDFDGTFQALRLEEGAYRIEVVAPGYEPLEFDVRIQPGRTIRYRGELIPGRP